MNVDSEPTGRYQPQPGLPNSIALEFNASHGLISNECDDLQLQPWDRIQQKLKGSRGIYIYIRNTYVGRRAKKRKIPGQAGM